LSFSIFLYLRCNSFWLW